MSRLSTAVTVLILVALTGCRDAPEPPKIRLTSEALESARRPVQPVKVPVRVAVAPVISPRENFRLYAPLMDYLAEKLDRPVEFLQRPTYSEINDLVRNGHADIAFVCDYAYILGQRDFGMQILAVPQIMGQITYHSLLIVPAESEAQSLENLRRKSFAFSDPLSSSGWLYPAYLLTLKGERPEAFFARTVFTYSHDNTIRAVANRLVDGGAVDSLVYDFMLSQSPDLARSLRVIGKSPAWGNPPVVVHPRIDSSLRERLRQILLSTHQDQAGKRLLANLMIDRFVGLDDTYYRDVRAMATTIKAQR
ncbi:MAG: phosphate/phosphite/phosphonate ABC transporter substrate-binding protein [Candidatus Methylomirabilis oxyfera]|nr:phosphate/phosphite/phosphonate ABC transporter substrate-binding protein [Candidatus Methylomirabilis oxyfera]